MFQDRQSSRSQYSECSPYVVEDDPDFQMLLLRAFEKAGVPPDRVRLASDGEEAVQTLGRMFPGAPNVESRSPSLVVLDLTLPKKSGLEVLAWLRESPTFRGTPAFILTSQDNPDHVTRAFELGVDSYFVKPAGFADLLSVVEGMLGYWHARVHRRLPRTQEPFLGRPGT